MITDFTRSYYNLLNGEYAGINLTRITDLEDFNNKQIIDSIAPLKSSQKFSNVLRGTKLMLDVGFGGGFPVLPIANECSDVNFVGIESRGKKAKVVSEIAGKLGLKNVKLYHLRLENLLVDVPVVITLKAVGKVNDFLSKINSEVAVEVYFYKGPNFRELEADQIKMTQKDWELIEEKELDVPGTEKRFLVGFRLKSGPIGAKSNKNRLVKLSSLK